MKEFVGKLPRNVEVVQGRPEAPFIVEDLGRLTITGYVDLSVHIKGAQKHVAQPLILVDEQPAVRPFRYGRVTDHTFFTFDRRMHTIRFPAAYGRLLYSSASKVLVDDDPNRDAMIDLYSQDLADSCHRSSTGLPYKAIIFSEPVPYDNESYFEAVFDTLPMDSQPVTKDAIA